MKTRLALALTVAASITAPAFAADLPTRKAPLPPPPLPLSWTGFYVGANAGGVWGNSSNSANEVFGYSPAGVGAGLSAAPGASGGSNSGFIGGLQVGYNKQFAGAFVGGLEADIQGVAGASRTVGTYGVGVDSAGVSYTSIGKRSGGLDYLGTVRGRIGYLVMPTLLVYGTGGLAYGGVSANAYFATAGSDGTGGGGALSYANTRAGWTAGGGVEWMFLPNWSAKVEYLYFDLGSATARGMIADAGNAWAFSAANTTRFNGNLVRAGVNYHFNWGAAPVVAKY